MGTDETYDVTKFKVMVYDGSKGKGLKVEAGSDNDLSDTKSGEPASLVIMQFRGGSNGPTIRVVCTSSSTNWYMLM